MTPPDNSPATTADRVFGPGNWVLCHPCPRNDGHRSIHQKDFHANYEAPTGTLTRPDHPSAVPEQPYCGQDFPLKGSPTPLFCELPHGHPGRCGVPRYDKWGPEPV